MSDLLQLQSPKGRKSDVAIEASLEIIFWIRWDGIERSIEKLDNGKYRRSHPN